MHPDDPASGAAFPTEGNLDTQRPQERLRAPQAAGGARGFFELIAAAHNRIPSLGYPRTKDRHLRQHRQHRLRPTIFGSRSRSTELCDIAALFWPLELVLKLLINLASFCQNSKICYARL
jgi:hypothetical protein